MIHDFGTGRAYQILWYALNMGIVLLPVRWAYERKLRSESLMEVGFISPLVLFAESGV